MELLIFFALIACSAFFSSAETAYFSLRHGEVHLMREKKKRDAELVHFLKHDPERLLITILIGNNIVSFSAASLATILGIAYFGSVGAGIATGLATFFILIFGEILPKAAAVTNNGKLALLYAKPVYFFYILFSPITWLLLKIHARFISYLHVKKQPVVSEEEIRAICKLGVEHGEIDRSEHEMIEKVFRFDDVQVKDIMTPKYRMEVLHGEVPVEQIAYFVSQAEYSRFPVDDEGKIIGYIHVNQIMKALNSDERDEVVAKFVSPIKSISENTTVDTVFREMQKDRTHMYLVHEEGDENETVGLVTMENVLEEIVGEIKDETDE